MVKYISLSFTCKCKKTSLFEFPKEILSYLEFQENHGELNPFIFAFKSKAIILINILEQ